MKKILSLFAFLLVGFAQAQYMENAPWMQNLNVQARKQSNNPVKFQEVIDAGNAYWETHDRDAKGSGYKPFKRWEEYWKNFVKEDGTLPTSKELWQIWEEHNLVNTFNRNGNGNSMVDESDWQPVGPFTHTNTGSWSSGQGRVNVIVKDANNPNYYYAGAPAGGFWKSTNGGATWEITTTDNLPQIGVSGIALDPDDSNIIYIATGDDDGGDSTSVGVMKSIDGGLTWNTTGLNVNNSPSGMNDIYVVKDVNTPTLKTIIVATTSGVRKSTNGGVSWTTATGIAGNVRDIKIKPGSSNEVYAVTSSALYKSTDMGNTFILVTSGIPISGSNRLVIDVTNANPDYVYVLAAASDWSYRAIYRSIDSGNTFSEISNQTQDGNVFESNQAWFDMAFAVSDTNPNEFYTGVLNVWKGIYNPTTLDTQFTQINNWNQPNTSTYTHADIHFLRFFEGELLVGSDGGFYRSTNGATSFTDLTAGMQISQFYRISVAKTTSNKMVGGLQDNGGHAYNNSTWQNYYGADGMDTAINPSNSNLYYGFTQNGGTLYVSNNAGGSISSTVGSPENGNWITPLTMNKDSELYAGYSSLYKLENNTFVQISESFPNNISIVEIDNINPDNIFIVTNRFFNNGTSEGTLRKSTDRGVTFTTMQVLNRAIASVEINEADSNSVYLTTIGVNGEVLKSINGGTTFNDISTGLPSVTKNVIKHQGLHSKNPLYLGTSLGVYRYDDDTLTWELFNIGLPNVTVRDLEINVFDNKITAATYGRGVWQSTIPTELAPTDLKLVTVDGISTSIECNANIAPQITIENNGLSTITAIDITYTVDGVDTVYNWTGTLNSEATTVVNIPQFSLAKGLHTFKATATTSNDAYDLNNDSEEKIILANAPGVIQVVNTFETPAEALLVQDDSAATQYWERGIPTGTLLNDNANPSNQVYGTNLAGLHTNNTKSYLISECYDLTTIADPVIKFDMAFNLETDWDIVYMEYSTDQGVNWSVLGAATDPNWYNSDTVPTNNCFNCPGAQWTGTDATLTEYSYDLAAFTNEANMLFRFVFHSDQSVVEEGVIVDNLVITGNALSVDEFSTQNFAVYPNPSKGVFNIKTKNIDAFNFSIYDVTGKRIMQRQNAKTIDNAYQINISNYSTGVYFLNISNDTSTITKKLIIK